MDWFTELYDFTSLPRLEGGVSVPPVLDARTRWVLEHVKKYPEPGKEEQQKYADEWVLVEGKDTLHFA